MEKTPSNPSPFTEAIIHGKRSEAYKAQERRLLSLQEGYSASLATIWLMATRSKKLTENSLSFAFTHDAFQTMAAVTFLASEGMYAPAKRELRYLLESAAKHAVVDLNNWNSSLDERINYLESCIPKSSVDFIMNQSFFGLSPIDEANFKASITSQFKRLSAFVHRSSAQLRQEIKLAGKGPPEPKLISSELERFNRECFAVYDFAVFLQLQVLGPGLSGDVFVHAFDPINHWPFHKGKFCRLLSKFYDYKVERQGGNNDC